MTLNKTEQNVGLTITALATALILLYIAFPIIGTNNEILMIATLLTCVIGSFIFWILVALYFRKNGKVEMINYLNIGVQRYILGMLMIFYGVPKLLGTFFDYQLFALDSKLSNVTEFQLAWFFYGKNKWLELFSGIMEFIPGIFLFIRKRYYLSSLVLLPVTSQVFILNFFFKIGGITFPAASILLACNLYLIYSQKDKIIQFFKSLNFEIFDAITQNGKTFFKLLKGLGIALVIISTFLRLKSSFGTSTDTINYQKMVGVYSLQTMLKNGTTYNPTTNDSTIYKTLYFEKQDRWNMLRRFNNKTSAFVMKLNKNDNSIKLFINTNGAGDEKDILDSTTVIIGSYKLDNDKLIIKGLQVKDTIELNYLRNNEIEPKKWFW